MSSATVTADFPGDGAAMRPGDERDGRRAAHKWTTMCHLNHGSGVAAQRPRQAPSRLWPTSQQRRPMPIAPQKTAWSAGPRVPAPATMTTSGYERGQQQRDVADQHP